MPCLVAEYAGDIRPPRKLNIEQMLMILPLRRGTMCLAASWLISNAAVRFTDTVASHGVRPKSSTSASGQIPAELMRTSMEPSRAMHSSTTRFGVPSAVMSASMNS